MSQQLTSTMINTKFLYVIVMINLIVATETSATQQTQQLEEIKSGVITFIKNNLSENPNQTTKIKIKHLDSRLKLTACKQLLNFVLPTGENLGRYATMSVSCAHPKPWSIFVPVEIMRFGPVVMTKGVLSRGHVIRAQDLYISNQDLNAKGRSYYSQVDDIIGMIVKTPVRSGTILRKRHLRLPTIIKRGQKVTIIAGRKQFEIRMTGQALMDGSKGDLIRVTNISSKKTVEGEVIRAGVIRIQL